MEAGAQPGDWVCSGGGGGGPAATGGAAPSPGCGNVNFARRPHCNRCGRRRVSGLQPPSPASASASASAPPSSTGVEIGKCAADKSRGLFAADDWQCAKCANVNWARRLTCNVCNAPKFGEVEARTGYGGGYNERGVVEYRPRRDSDEDDYDEFGRVKKRKGKDSSQANKVCGKRRHLGSISDSSPTSPIPLMQRPKPDSGELQGRERPPNARDVVSAFARNTRKRSSTDNPTMLNEPDNVSDKRPTEKMHFLYNNSKYKHFHRDYPDGTKYKQYQRDCIMENRVSSTNELKYRFVGKTVDENFEVTYTLQERIHAAAWAIAYNNCRTSAEKFQTYFDKPAPDFNTIFAWRQRLLNTGCFIDLHVHAETSSRDTSESRLKRRKKRRYFRSTSRNDAISSEDECDDVPARSKESRESRNRNTNKADEYSNARRRSFNRNLSSDSNKSCDSRNKGWNAFKTIEANDVVVINSENDKKLSKNGKKSTDKSDDDSNNSGIKRFSNTNTNESVGRSSKHSAMDGSKRSDGFLTDNARSITPEITMTRIELAHLNSPVKTASPETQFQEDNYFDDPKQSKNDIESTFLIPNVPRWPKPGVQPIINNIPKEMLEDIVSESERYSSDGGFDSDVDIHYKENDDITKKNVPEPVVESPFKNLKLQNQKNTIYSPKVSGLKKTDISGISLLKFGQNETSNSPSPKLSFNDVEKSSLQNFSPAMMRIMGSMSNQPEDKIISNIEYIPTKIDPAMAKRNHLLFTNNSMNDIWAESNTSSTNKNLKEKATELSIPSSRAMYADYLPDEDALYRDDGSDHKTDDEVLRTPPKAPNIGSISKKNVNMTTTTTSTTTTPTTTTINSENNITSFLNLNFSQINTDNLALALESVYNMSLNKSKGDVESPKSITVSDSPAKKDNIPFLDDMFYPGSPSPKEDGRNADAIENIAKNANMDLVDDLLDGGQPKKDVVSSVSRFKSFAFPTPITLNRLHVLQQPKKVSDDANGSKNAKPETNTKKKNRPSEDNNGHKGDVSSKKLYDEDVEDEEESGEEGDLSKYDLWGSDEENDKNKDVKSSDKDKSSANLIADKEASNKSEINNQRKERAKSPITENRNRRGSERSQSASSKRSSSSSSSSATSSGKPPRNRYDDFILNSEHSKTGSRESSSARSRSPVYDRGRDKDKRRSRSKDKAKDRSRENRDRDRDRDRNKPRDNRDTNKSRDSRDKGRDRDRDRQRHHCSGTHSNHGFGYTRGRAR